MNADSKDKFTTETQRHRGTEGMRVRSSKDEGPKLINHLSLKSAFICEHLRRILRFLRDSAPPRSSFLFSQIRVNP